MKKIECWQADDGALEKDPLRAKAHDLHAALPKSTANPNSKVLDWNDCLHIMENADIVLEHLEQWRELRAKAEETQP